MYNKALELYNDLLETYFDEHFELSDGKRKKIEPKYEPSKLFLEAYNYDARFEKEKSVDLSDMPALEGDEEEVKEGKGLKILTPNKLFTRLSILLAQIKAGNNSYKLKKQVKQILYLLLIIKSPKNFTTI